MEQNIKIWEHPQFGEIGVAIDDGKLWFESGAIVQLKHKKKSMGGNDYPITEGHRKKFRFSYQKNGRGRFSRTFVDLVGARQLAEHTEDENNKKRTQEFVDWLAAEAEKEKDLELFSKLPPFVPKEPCINGEKKSNIYDCIETTRNDLNGKIGELQGIFDIMLAKWKTCVDTGLRYKSERDSAKADPQKMESLEFRLTRLKVILGRHDLRAKRSAYDQLGRDFPINGESPLHEPQEIAKYFGITSQELNDWLMKNGLQEKVENPSWGEAKYRPLPTPLSTPLAEVVYREEEKGQKFYHLQWNELGLAYIVGAWICEHEYIND